MLRSGDRVLAVGRARARYVWPWWLLLASVLYGGVILLNDLLHPAGKEDPHAIPVALYGLIVVFGGGSVVMRFAEHRRVPVVITATTVQFGRFGAAPIPSAGVLGRWYQDRTGVELGSVLHLAGDRGPILVGARRHRRRFADDPRYATRTVQVVISAVEFEELLAQLFPGIPRDGAGGITP